MAAALPCSATKIPFVNGAGSNQTVTFGVDYKHFRNVINENSTTAYDTPISYLNLSFAYGGFWRTKVLTTTFNVTANAGPRNLVNNQIFKLIELT